MHDRAHRQPGGVGHLRQAMPRSSCSDRSIPTSASRRGPRRRWRAGLDVAEQHAVVQSEHLIGGRRWPGGGAKDLPQPRGGDPQRVDQLDERHARVAVLGDQGRHGVHRRAAGVTPTPRRGVRTSLVGEGAGLVRLLQRHGTVGLDDESVTMAIELGNPDRDQCRSAARTGEIASRAHPGAMVREPSDVIPLPPVTTGVAAVAFVFPHGSPTPERPGGARLPDGYLPPWMAPRS